jgi:hypothetical protein
LPSVELPIEVGALFLDWNRIISQDFSVDNNE